LNPANDTGGYMLTDEEREALMRDFHRTYFSQDNADSLSYNFGSASDPNSFEPDPPELTIEKIREFVKQYENITQPDSLVIVGCDPARGIDRGAIVAMRGDTVLFVQSFLTNEWLEALRAAPAIDAPRDLLGGEVGSYSGIKFIEKYLPAAFPPKPAKTRNLESRRDQWKRNRQMHGRKR
jgi:hypothetical protein